MAKTDKKSGVIPFAVNVELVWGDDFTVVFGSREEAENGIRSCIKDGYVARDRTDDASKHVTQYYPLAQVKRFSLHVPDKK